MRKRFVACNAVSGSEMRLEHNKNRSVERTVKKPSGWPLTELEPQSGAIRASAAHHGKCHG